MKIRSVDKNKLSIKSKTIIILIIFFIVFLSHVFSLNPTSSDSRWAIPTAMSIIYEGNLNLDEYFEMIQKNQFYAIEKIKNHYFTRYPIGTHLIAVPPVYVIDKLLKFISLRAPRIEQKLKLYIENNYYQKYPDFKNKNKIDPVAIYPGVELIIASLIVAITAIFIFLISLNFLDWKASLFIVFIFAFCTSAWSTASRALWQHGPSMLALSIALYFLVLSIKNPKMIVFSGLPLAFAFIIRPINIVSLVIITFYVLIFNRRLFLYYLFLVSLIIIPFIIYNYKIYDFILSPYYLKEGKFGERHIFEALLGNLFSPSRGLLIFTPVFLFSLIGFLIKIRNKRVIKLDYFLFFIICLNWIAISLHPYWWGGYSFGPRLFSDIIPYFIYFIIFFVQEIYRLRGFWGGLLVLLFFLTVALSFLVHFRGATSRATYEWNWKPTKIETKVWQWRDIQFLRGL